MKEKNAIVQLIEKIERLNKMIRLHEGYEEPDRLAIQQYKDMKDDLAKFLFDSLLQFDLKKQIKEYVSVSLVA